jgi:hypothetical protein
MPIDAVTGPQDSSMMGQESEGGRVEGFGFGASEMVKKAPLPSSQHGPSGFEA